MSQIVRFYKGNPLQLICKVFVWLSQFHATEEKWDQPQQQTEMSIYEGRLFKNQSRKGRVKIFMTMSESKRNPAG